ncbi:MAG: sulfotransferase [Actinomycetota bacterium]|nr:sulfotransferase [Actinomycetota bacterium]
MSRAVCVLGMMRTGTSAVAGVLELLGAHFGPEERLLEPNVANPAGFREHKGIIALNDELLAHLGGTWHAPPENGAGWEDDPELQDVRRQASEIIDSDLATHEVWAWKDPRTCLTLPFWQALVPSLLPVICVRGPAETAQSFASMGWAAVDRLEHPYETGLDLWLRYTSDALEQTREHARLLIFYDDLIDDPLGESERLAAFTDTSQGLTPDRRRTIAEFLRPSLRHQRPREDVGEHAAFALYSRLRETRE